MKSPEETPRLLDETGIDGELKLGLERMSANVPSTVVMASLAARLGVKPPPVNGHASASKTLLKAVATAGVSGIVLWALLRGTAPEPADISVASQAASAPAASHAERTPPNERGATPPNERAPIGQGARPAPVPSARTEETPPLALPEPAVAAPEVSKPSERATAANPRPAESPAPAPERAAPKAPSKTPGATSDTSSALSRAPAAAPPSETSLLRDARLALNGDPAGALALTEQHRREYPNGGLAQEREVIAITALARLGRTSEARSRAERFRSSYPTSPYIDRVDRAVPP
jgi:hypothetical protein